MKNRYYLHSSLRGLSLVWFPTFVLWLQSQYRLDMAAIYRLQALSLLCALLFEVPAGLGADRWGRKVTLLIGPVCFLASYLTFALGSTFGHALAATVLSALGNACFSGIMGSALFESLKQEEASSAYPRIVAKARLWNTVSSALAMGSCGWVNATFGQRWGFFIAAGISAAMLVNLLNIKVPPTAAREKLATSQVAQALKGILGESKTISLLLVGLMAATQERLYTLILNPIWSQHGIPSEWFGVLMAGQAALATLVVVLFINKLKPNLRSPRTAQVLCLLTSLCLLAMSATSMGMVAIVLPFATHTLLALIGISCYASLQAVAPPSARATFMSFVAWVEMLGAAAFFGAGAFLSERNDVLLLSKLLVALTLGAMGISKAVAALRKAQVADPNRDIRKENLLLRA